MLWLFDICSHKIPKKMVLSIKRQSASYLPHVIGGKSKAYWKLNDLPKSYVVNQHLPLMTLALHHHWVHLLSKCSSYSLCLCKCHFPCLSFWLGFALSVWLCLLASPISSLRFNSGTMSLLHLPGRSPLPFHRNEVALSSKFLGRPTYTYNNYCTLPITVLFLPSPPPTHWLVTSLKVGECMLVMSEFSGPRQQLAY